MTHSIEFERFWLSNYQTIGKVAAGAAWRHQQKKFDKYVAANEDTLAIARQQVKEEIHKKGIYCPVCDQFAKVYPRKIYGAMAVMLLTLHRLNFDNDDFHHIRDIARPGGFPAAGGDFAKLRYWLLIEEAEPDPDGVSRSPGSWRITEHGKRFCRGKVRVPEVANIYNGECTSYASAGNKTVTIKGALGEKYDYHAVMGIAL